MWKPCRSIIAEIWRFDLRPWKMTTKVKWLLLICCISVTVLVICCTLMANTVVYRTLTTTFDAIVHATLLSRLHNSFDVGWNALSWISSYSSGRSQTVCVGSASSTPSSCGREVPQGIGTWADHFHYLHISNSGFILLVLGPITFTIYTSSISGLFWTHHHLT